MSAETVQNGVTAEPSGVDDAVGMHNTGKWFVAIVNSRHEKAISAKLDAMGIENYVALQKEMHLWKNGRRRLIDRIVIPAIIFIRCSEQRRRSIVALPYINRFMVNRSSGRDSLSRPVAVIPDAEIDKLKFMLGQSDSKVDFEPTVYRVSDTVRVIRGSLRGLVGEIAETPDGRHSLRVAIAQLGCAILSISPTDIEKI